MASRVTNRIRPAMIGGTLAVALAFASTPAKAHHGADFVVPLAAIIAFGALAHHSHHHHHHHYYRYHGHGHRPYYRPYRRHSHSHGGYYRRHHKHHRHW